MHNTRLIRRTLRSTLNCFDLSTTCGYATENQLESGLDITALGGCKQLKKEKVLSLHFQQFVLSLERSASNTGYKGTEYLPTECTKSL